jgi:transposase
VLPSWTAVRCGPRRKAARGQGYDGAKRKRGSKLHLAVDTLGHLLALHVTPARPDDRAEAGRLVRTAQSTTGQNIDLAYVDRGYTSPKAADAAKAHGIELEVIKLPDAKRGFVLLPRRWVVERSCAGQPASAGWQGTTKATPTPSPTFTLSPLSASGSNRSGN